jgi:hypothetical protein
MDPFDISGFAQPREKRRTRYLRRRGDNQVDLLDLQEGGQGGALLYEKTLDDEAAKRAAAQGYSWVDGNMYEATAKPHRKKVDAPPGRTPFFIGDKAEHPAQSKPAAKPLDDALSWAAGLGRVTPRPDVEVDVGQPTVISRTPAAPTRPRISVRAAGQVSEEEKRRVLANAQRQPLQAPSGLKSVFDIDPEVGEYLSKYRDEELKGAQGQANDLLLAARLTRAGAMGNHAISQARYDDGALDDLESTARQPVTNLQERRRSEAEIEERGMAREDMGMRRADFQRRGAADTRDHAFRVSQAEREEALQRARMEQDAQQHQDTLRSRALDRAESREERRLRLELAAQEKAERVADKNAQIQHGRDEKMQAELAKRGDSLARLKSDIETINRTLSTPGDMPGAGVWDSMKMENSVLRAVFASQEDTETWQASQRMLKNYINSVSGASYTDAEIKQSLAAYGVKAGSSEQDFRVGMTAFIRDAKRGLLNKQAGFNKGVVDDFRARGGTTAEDMPEPAARPTGRIKRRGAEVYAELEDGSAVRIR